jgi:holo-ACP synthase
MDMAENAFAEEFHTLGWKVRQHSRIDGLAGPEALWVAETSPDRLKRLAMKIEDSRPWGRLLDADVILAGIRKEPFPLGRQTLGGEPRPCLLCGAEARECIGLRRHHPASAAAMVAALIGRITGLP